MGEQGPNTLRAVFSMDCLPSGGQVDVRGAGSWQRAAGAPVAFVKALRDLGFGATLFIAPEALARLAAPVRDLRAAGCELGVLCHPQLSGYPACLGAYNYDRQTEIVRLAVKVWQDAVGEDPVTFRPGFFSANDYTYHVLCMQGFRQGSCSLPGRIDNEQCSMWFNSYPFPHHTDPLDRIVQGTMEFLEVPVTSDFDAASFISYETFTPGHLRIEEPDIHDYARDLVLKHLDAMEEDDVPVRALHFVTSNVTGWGEAEDPHIERLRNLCTMLHDVADERGMELCPSSLEGVHEASDRALPERPDEDAEA